MGARGGASKPFWRQRPRQPIFERQWFAVQARGQQLTAQHGARQAARAHGGAHPQAGQGGGIDRAHDGEPVGRGATHGGPVSGARAL